MRMRRVLTKSVVALLSNQAIDAAAAAAQKHTQAQVGVCFFSQKARAHQVEKTTTAAAVSTLLLLLLPFSLRFWGQIEFMKEQEEISGMRRVEKKEGEEKEEGKRRTHTETHSKRQIMRLMPIDWIFSLSLFLSLYLCRCFRCNSIWFLLSLSDKKWERKILFSLHIACSFALSFSTHTHTQRHAHFGHFLLQNWQNNCLQLRMIIIGAE